MLKIATIEVDDLSAKYCNYSPSEFEDSVALSRTSVTGLAKLLDVSRSDFSYVDCVLSRCVRVTRMLGARPASHDIDTPSYHKDSASGNR